MKDEPDVLDEGEERTDPGSKRIVIKSPLAKPQITVIGKVGCQANAVNGDASAYLLINSHFLVENMHSRPS